MRWCEIAEDVRSNVLYHATTVDNLYEILEDNEITARTAHPITHTGGARRSRHWAVRPSDITPNGYLEGVSLTRNVIFARAWQSDGVLLVLNADAIRRDFRVRPISFWGQRRKIADESEEFVIGSIAPLSRYLFGIEASRSTLVRHPLLNDIPTLFRGIPPITVIGHVWRKSGLDKGTVVSKPSLQEEIKTERDALKKEILRLHSLLPANWNDNEGRTTYKNPRLDRYIDSHPEMDLHAVKAEYEKLVALVAESPPPSPLPVRDDQNRAILADMFTRADHDAMREWAAENGVDDLSGDDDMLDAFEEWLDMERSVTVRDGMVHFWKLYEPDIAEMIGDNPVLLFHFTSSSRVPSIRRHGLVAGKRSVNRTTTPGVYLTTETDGPAIRGYLHNALRGTKKAYGVRIDVRTYLSELQPDPDDADIMSGETQFVTDYVAPDQIVAFHRA